VLTVRYQESIIGLASERLRVLILAGTRGLLSRCANSAQSCQKAWLA